MYSKHNSDPNFYIGKAVMILGKGNSAMETATNIHGKAKQVLMLSPNKMKMALETGYVGNTRLGSHYGPQILDSHFLKVLDGVGDATITKIEKCSKTGKLLVHFITQTSSESP